MPREWEERRLALAKGVGTGSSMEKKTGELSLSFRLDRERKFWTKKKKGEALGLFSRESIFLLRGIHNLRETLGGGKEKKLLRKKKGSGGVRKEKKQDVIRGPPMDGEKQYEGGEKEGGNGNVFGQDCDKGSK